MAGTIIHSKKLICEACKGDHDGLYGSGRFCSPQCARFYSTKDKRADINQRVSATLKAKGITVVRPFRWPKGKPRGSIYPAETGTPHRDAYRHLNTFQRGRLAEIYFEAECLKRGIDVYRPTIDGGRFDFLIAIDGSYRRAQIKWSNGVIKNGCISVQLGRPRGNRRARRSRRVAIYSAAEIDLVFAYLPVIEKFIVLVPRDFSGKTSLLVRVRKPLNSGGSSPIRFAESFFLDAILPVAQLEEQKITNLQVGGSSPLGKSS